jgi:hypothetical protein
MMGAVSNRVLKNKELVWNLVSQLRRESDNNNPVSG